MDDLRYLYGWEKLNQAMYFLIGPGSQKERLVQAIAPLSLIRSEQNLPRTMRAEFSEFIKEMKRKATVAATVQDLSAEELADAVEVVLILYDQICRYMPEE